MEAERQEAESNLEQEKQSQDAKKKALSEFWAKTHELYGENVLEQMSKIIF